MSFFSLYNLMVQNILSISWWITILLSICVCLQHCNFCALNITKISESSFNVQFFRPCHFHWDTFICFFKATFLIYVNMLPFTEFLISRLLNGSDTNIPLSAIYCTIPFILHWIFTLGIITFHLFHALLSLLAFPSFHYPFL